MSGREGHGNRRRERDSWRWKSIDVGELVGVQEDEANLGEGAGFHIDIGRLEVGNEILVGEQRLGEGEQLARFLGARFPADFGGILGAAGGSGLVVGLAVAPVVEAGSDLVIRWRAVEGDLEEVLDEGASFRAGVFGQQSMGESEGAVGAAVAVEQAEDLRSDGGGIAHLAGEVGTGFVEDFHASRISSAVRRRGMKAA